MLPFATWLALFLLGPLSILVATSFFRRTPGGLTEEAFELTSYLQLFDPLYLEIFLRSFSLAAANTALCLLLGFPLAYFIARQRPQMRWIFLSLILVPLSTSFLIRVFSVIEVLRFKPFGIELIYTLPGILVAMVYNYLPYAVLPMYASLVKMDWSLLEAAADLGASKRKSLTQILLPLNSSAIFTAALFTFIPSLGEFLIPNLVGGSKYFLIGNFLHNQFMTARNWPLGSATISLLVILALLSMVLLQKIKSREGRDA